MSDKSAAGREPRQARDGADADLLRLPTGDAPAEERERIRQLHRWLTPAVCRRLGIYELPEDFRLSVVIPVYNERSTVREVVERVQATMLPVEIILVDDGSTDGTSEVLDSLEGEPDVRVVRHRKNQGKGAALRSGLSLVQGNVVVIQDADLEYDPEDYRLLLQPILEDRADVVYGSRFAKPDHQVDQFWHQNGNRLITLLSNLFTNLKLTDVETCYKMMRSDMVLEIAATLQEKGFGVELEMTAKLAKRKTTRFYEVPISYQSRTYEEGKKIHWRDAVWAVWCILRY